MVPELSPPRALLDLGAGGGVPGLALALAWPACRVVLLDASSRRCAFLQGALHELGLEATGAVAHGRAELLARDPVLAGAFDLVTARSFAPPGTTAECGVRFLAADGLLVVSEPPDPADVADRWPSDGLASLGLGAAEPLNAAGWHVVRIPLVSSCPEQYPRRDGVPAKRPLF